MDRNFSSRSTLKGKENYHFFALKKPKGITDVRAVKD